MCVPRTQPAARTFLSPSKPLHPHISKILCKTMDFIGNIVFYWVSNRCRYLVWLFIARSMSRLASRSAMEARLSYSFLPLHNPKSTLTLLPLK